MNHFAYFVIIRLCLHQMRNIFSHDSSSVSLQRAARLYSGMDQQPVCSPLNKILDVSVISYIIEHMFIYIPVELFAVPCLALSSFTCQC